MGLTAATGSVALAEAPEPEEGYMAKAVAAWTSARAWLPSGRWWAAGPPPDVTLPTDKLRSHLPPAGACLTEPKECWGFVYVHVRAC